MNRSPARLWDFPAAAVLLFVLLTAGQRLYVTGWAAGLGTGIFLSFIGLLLGMALGFSRFKRWAIIGLTLGYSLPVVILTLGGFLYRRIPWMERLADISDRMAYAFSLFTARQTVYDTILFIVFIALVLWMVGLMAGYAMTRFGNFIGAVAPAGVVMLIVQLYDPGRENGHTYLAVFFFLSLLYLGRMTYAQRTLYWKEHRLAMLAESRVNLHITLAVAALAAVLLAWLAPTSAQSFINARTAWQNLTRPLREMQKDLGHAVGGLQGGGQASTVQFYGGSLALGRQAATGEAEYLRVQAPQASSTGRYYWRVRTYNIYRNNHWQTGNVSVMPFSPDQARLALTDPGGVTGNFVFTALSTNLAGLVTPARPVWVSYPSELVFVQDPQGKVDPIQFQPDPSVTAGEKYSVRASIYEPTIAQLRSAGEAYPEWDNREYLQLPEELSPQITALAQQIAAGAGEGEGQGGQGQEAGRESGQAQGGPTPYDVAEAITAYLRSNISYADMVEEPPEGRDALEWFLFDSRRGFCNYYASAEVILLRAAGIPARLVAGFAQGGFEPPDSYVVRQQDAHAWPEAYFPGVGWVEFEPTVSQAPLERPQDEIPGPSEEDDAESHAEIARGGDTGEAIPRPGSQNAASSGWIRPANWLLRLIFLFLIISSGYWVSTSGMLESVFKVELQFLQIPLPVLLKRLLEKRALAPPGWLQRWAYQAELDPIERSFLSVYRSLQGLGMKPTPAQTPAEAAEALAGLLPNVSAEIRSLADEYQRQVYSHRHGYLPMVLRAEKVIRKEARRAARERRWRTVRALFRPGG